MMTSCSVIFLFVHAAESSSKLLMLPTSIKVGRGLLESGGDVKGSGVNHERLRQGQHRYSFMCLK